MPKYHITVFEEATPGEPGTEILCLRVDAHPDIPALVSLLTKAPRAPRSDKGKKREEQLNLPK